jgi:hypothetical protein
MAPAKPERMLWNEPLIAHQHSVMSVSKPVMTSLTPCERTHEPLTLLILNIAVDLTEKEFLILLEATTNIKAKFMF